MFKNRKYLLLILQARSNFVYEPILNNAQAGYQFSCQSSSNFDTDERRKVTTRSQSPLLVLMTPSEVVDLPISSGHQPSNNIPARPCFPYPLSPTTKIEK